MWGDVSSFLVSLSIASPILGSIKRDTDSTDSVVHANTNKVILVNDVEANVELEIKIANEMWPLNLSRSLRVITWYLTRLRNM